MSEIAPPGGRPHLLEAMKLTGLLREQGKTLNWKEMQLLAVKNNIRLLQRALFSAIEVGMIEVQFSVPPKRSTDGEE